MMSGQAGLSFLGRHLPASLESRVVVLPPGRDRAYDAAEWRGAIVLVERGQIELSWSGSGRHRFRRGDLLWLDGLALRYLHNRGLEPAVLVAVSRRPAPLSAGSLRQAFRSGPDADLAAGRERVARDAGWSASSCA